MVLKDFGRMVVADVPQPQQGAGEVLIKITAVGICGTDVHGFTGENGRRQPGQIMGHEAAGTVAATPADSGLRVGQAVTFNPLITCGACAPCHDGAEQHCADRRVIGVNPEIQAAFAEFVAVPVPNVVPLPDTLPVAHGALIEPLAVAFNAVRRAGVGAGDGVLVIGAGPIGQSVVLAARDAGAELIMVSDINAERRDLCARLGASTLDPTTADTATEYRARAGAAADVTIDAVGISATLQAALGATRPGGTVVLVGMGAKRLEFGAFDLTTMERSLIGSFCYTRADFARAARWAGSHAAELAGLVSAELPFDQAPRAFEQLAGSSPAPGKVLVRADW
nr:alcohol dehydrogenase catalytic domain-containing protein [Microlunatus panaciterrae]